jgi:hypothetical protein
LADEASQDLSFNSIGGGLLKKRTSRKIKFNGVMHINTNGNAIVLASTGVDHI